MSLRNVMSELKKAGTAQNVKVYKRHGASEPLFGVSFAHLKKMEKKLRGETELAMQLWKTKNTDAQTLALMIANPSEVSAKTIDSWVKDVDYTLLAGYFGSLVGKTKYADSRMKKWMKSKKEYTCDCGFSILSSRLKEDADTISKDDCKTYLKFIEANIHRAPNRAKHAMNTSLMAIGIFKKGMASEAIKVAKKIGALDVDHGETNCKTPYAADYIQKALKRKKA